MFAVSPIAGPSNVPPVYSGGNGVQPGSAAMSPPGGATVPSGPTNAQLSQAIQSTPGLSPQQQQVLIIVFSRLPEDKKRQVVMVLTQLSPSQRTEFLQGFLRQIQSAGQMNPQNGSSQDEPIDRRAEPMMEGPIPSYSTDNQPAAGFQPPSFLQRLWGIYQSLSTPVQWGLALLALVLAGGGGYAGFRLLRNTRASLWLQDNLGGAWLFMLSVLGIGGRSLLKSPRDLPTLNQYLKQMGNIFNRLPRQISPQKFLEFLVNPRELRSLDLDVEHLPSVEAIAQLAEVNGKAAYRMLRRHLLEALRAYRNPTAADATKLAEIEQMQVAMEYLRRKMGVGEFARWLGAILPRGGKISSMEELLTAVQNRILTAKMKM